jgi:hypothetical protein
MVRKQLGTLCLVWREHALPSYFCARRAHSGFGELRSSNVSIWPLVQPGAFGTRLALPMEESRQLKLTQKGADRTLERMVLPRGDNNVGIRYFQQQFI